MMTPPNLFSSPINVRAPELPLNLLLNFREQVFGNILTSRLYSWAQLISIILSIALMVAIIYLYRENKKLEHHPRVPRRGPSEKFKSKNVVKDLWVNILSKVQRGGEQDLAFAIIEADKLIDTILKSSGFSGDTMADRMKRINPSQLAALDDLWEAHKIRNYIVHTPGYKVTPELAKNVLRNYEKVLKELEAI